MESLGLGDSSEMEIEILEVSVRCLQLQVTGK